MTQKFAGEAITFDDVLLLPRYSEVIPKDVDTSTRFSRNLELRIPISSAAMDTVTESGLAIALAQEGGIGIIHRNMSLEEHVREVDKVKRSANGVILDPVSMTPDGTIGEAKQIMAEHNISGLPIVHEPNRVVGILTARDLRFQESSERRVEEVMTKGPLVTAPPTTTLDEARAILHRNKVEKLLLVSDENRLEGMITIKDINKLEEFPLASRDGRGRLRAGAAVGVHDYERVDGLIEAGVDVIVVDTAHGNSVNVIETVRRIKEKHSIDVVAGNIATRDAAENLIRAGADAVKVGIGPGSVCTTRVVAGVGVPQITAIRNCVEAAEGGSVPVIADGGIRHSGDIAKAIAAGAHCVMIGGLFAGLEESPGEQIIYKGRTFKAFRGMGSTGAMVEGSKSRYGQADVKDPEKLVPEGVEGRVPYKGTLSPYVYQLVGGLRASMGYCGSKDIVEHRTNTQFIRISPASGIENHPHDVTITREAPNYRIES